MSPPLLYLILLFGLLLCFPLGVFPLPVLALKERLNFREQDAGKGRYLVIGNPCAVVIGLLSARHGITQFYSMACAVADGIEDFDLTILYGSRTKDTILLKEELEAVAARSNGRVKVVHVLSDEAAEGYEHGFITAELIRKYAGEEEYSLFLCGPKAMYDFANKPGFGGFMSCWWRNALCMAGGIVLIMLIEYSPFFAGIGPGADLLFGSTFGGPFMSLMIVFVPQVLVFSVLCTLAYRKTGSVYTGAFTVAAMAAWIVTGGSAMI